MGFTYVELMVAALISIIVCSVLIQTYLIQKRSYHLIRGLAEIQENARVAYYLLKHDIQNAGYSGCSIKAAKLLSSKGWISFEPQQSLCVDNIPTRVKLLKAPDSDVISIQTIASPFINVTKAVAHHVNLAENVPYKTGDILWLTNCMQGELLQVQAVANTHRIITTQSLKDIYADGSQIGVWQHVFYFIGNTKRNTYDGKPVKALFRLNLAEPNTTPLEMIEGVEGMHVYYASPGSVFQKAEVITNWNKVTRVRIILLLNSLQPVFDKENIYTFDGQSYLAGDRFLHKEWIMIFKLHREGHE